MNKMIARRNPFERLNTSYRYVGRGRVQAHQEVLQRWWKRTNERDVGLFKFWSRQEKKQFLLPGTDAYDKWKARYVKYEAMDPNMPHIVGRHVLAPVDVCWSADRKFKFSLVKVNAQGRRRRF